ncbi:cytochrome P450 [Panus rudis PR-1116 ss-1]|nr:cytochrome P450 [Panus rudis PR-1116 ss-1]
MLLSELTVGQIGFAFIVGWLVWYVLQRTSSSPLDVIPGPQSVSWVKGNLDQLFDRHGWNFQDELADKYQSVVKFHNMFGRRALFVYDPRALYHIFVKDQYVHELTPWFAESINLAFGPGLLATYGEQHRRQRKILNPVFSIKHMRYMTPIFYQVAHNLVEGINKQLAGTTKEVDMLKWMHRTALELVGQGGLGHSFDPLTDDDYYSEYSQALKGFIPSIFALSFWRMLLPVLVKLGPAPFRRFIVDILPSKRAQRMKNVADTILVHTKEILRQKREALAAGDEAVVHQVGEGKDILSVLLRANTEATETERLSEDELLGAMGILVFAATDTSSGALSQILHKLAENPEVQAKLRTEIREARKKADGDVPHDELMAMPYLEAIVRETLRMYPPVTFVSRETFKDIVLPLSKPIRDINGREMQEIMVPKGTLIASGIRATNLNKEIWGPDAREWKPERWLEPLPATVAEAHLPGVYSNLMTFIGGGRACIGFKFAQLEMKVVLSLLLDNFEFSMADCGKDIFWNLAGVRYPTVGMESNRPQMPMKVTPIGKD